LSVALLDAEEIAEAFDVVDTATALGSERDSSGETCGSVEPGPARMRRRRADSGNPSARHPVVAQAGRILS
jgi:hypothetical protein